jgi:trimeric autotransporter adhesin
MAFENPLLRPSATRQAALQYLWSDEPESAIQASPAPSSSSSIGNFFGVGEASPSTGQATPAAPAAPTSSGGGENSSGIAVAEATPYGGLFGGLPGLAVSAINMGVPGFGAMYGAASGYGSQVSANNLGTAMAAWGGDPNVSGSPALAALGGAFGYTPEGLENAQAFAGNFSNEANMSGYIAAADSSTPIGSLTQAIAATQLGQTNAEMTTDQYGKLGLDTVNAVNTSMASGKSLSQAMTDVGVAEGVPTTAIAAIAANFNTQDPIGQLAANLGLAPDPQEAVNAQANAMPVDPGIQAAIAAQAAQAAEGYSAGGYSAGGWVDSQGNPVTDSSGQQVQSSESAASMAAAEASDAAGNAAAAAAQAQAEAQAAVNAQANAMSVDPGIQAAVAAAEANASQGGVSAGQAAVNAADAAAVASAEAAMAASIGGGGGSGDKIICTAMNEAYGFGSFRNAIWIKYSNQHLTKEHEKGYHALFLPLVDYGFKQGDGTMNKIVRKVLEWGTRHRSTDLRAEMRGKKRDTTGRIIRAIFEPLCYFVGKYK